MVNLKTRNCKNATNTWYLHKGPTKHVSRKKSNFKGLKNSIKIYNIKSTRGQTHGVHGKGKVKLSFCFGKIKTISNVHFTSQVFQEICYLLA
jgi:hypothetical protein